MNERDRLVRDYEEAVNERDDALRENERLKERAATVARVWTAFHGEEPGITASGWMRDVHRAIAELRTAITQVGDCGGVDATPTPR